MRGIDVGSCVSSINLRMVPSDEDPAWHVDMVEVSRP